MSRWPSLHPRLEETLRNESLTLAVLLEARPYFHPTEKRIEIQFTDFDLGAQECQMGMFQNSGSLKTAGFLVKSTISIGFGGSLILKHNGIDSNKCMYKLFGLNEILHGKPACLPDSVAALALSLSNSGSSTSA